MRKLSDFTILQRDNCGYANAVFDGEFENDGKSIVVVRVIREDDNMTIIPWQNCDIDSNKWSISLRIPQGGLYRIEARQADGEYDKFNNRYDWSQFIACVSHIGVGDVFILAGQSNMSGYGKDTAYDPPQLGVHLYDNSGNWVIASHPIATVPNPIYPNDDGRSGTSPALSFGRIMSKRLNLPVGLISAACGGSSLESWNPSDENPYLYESMKQKIEAVGGFAAMVWYQGCNDTNDEEAPIYFDKFSQAVNLWREEFGDFPIITCQMNRHASKEDDNDIYWGMVREAQRQSSIQLKDVFIVPTLDMTTSDGIHNSSSACVTVGERIANVLLHARYNMPGSFAPSVKSARQIDERSIELKFFTQQSIRTMDDLAHGLNIEDENGLMKCISVELYGNGLKVTGERKIIGKAYFHAYWEKEVPSFFIRDVYGLPMVACYNVPIEK